MSTRGVADVIFCLDASDSMTPCIQAVKRHIVDFVSGLTSSQQGTWDLRLDFVAHAASVPSPGRVIYMHKSAREPELHDVLYLGRNGHLFVSDLGDFRQPLDGIRTAGDEASLVALDFCLDFPWRPANECHRVVIMLTDEPLETGVIPDRQAERLDDLMAKIQQLRVMLFIVAPESEAYNRLSAVQRSEYQPVESSGTGLADVDFSKVLGYMGRSVSKSALQGGAGKAPKRGLFGQASWVRTGESLTGA